MNCRVIDKPNVTRLGKQRTKISCCWMLGFELVFGLSFSSARRSSIRTNGIPIHRHTFLLFIHIFIPFTMNRMVLNAQRLQKLATWEHLDDSWYLVATVTLTVCNKPHEIPKLYHYAMHTKNMKVVPNAELYNKVDTILEKFADIKATGKDMKFNPYEKHITGGIVGSPYYQTSDKMRESILKTAALSGLPKAINSMMILKDNTPLTLRSHNNEPNRGKIESWKDYEKTQKRGKEYWDKVYTKISGRVTNQMSSSYPDLWTYTIENVYSPLLSFNEVLTPKETSLVVIASLVPQDVNPQLKGHLKGAVNSGIPIEQVRAARDLAVEIGGWCGITWEAEVAQA